ncbi:saccharopine dehydrogenase-like oxidoreductase isoform X1 [Nerophis ophidion]|uniref:saccharopine dehydrogenase-like oxidoreductase isoform X1 n=1 Tax=Nerophis ophidion TaxID=159077 RepID=UPI002AE0AD9C|nr:saccharopine dehydrogenase-like oxidoreductase isoform X1 [Nerophis ophidion]
MEAVTFSRKYHIIIFGASGFTGKFVAEEVARYAADTTGDQRLKWAVAGRSRARLEVTLKHVADKLATPQLSTDVDIITADVSDKQSLAAMCGQSLLVVNCVGPYRFYGEPVVAACVENGAHYIDICGEPQFLERMQLLYHTKALDRGVYVIGSCGFDSIPADLGIIYTQEHFKGTLTAVESFLTISSGPRGTCGHDATWRSAVHGFADSGSLRQLRRSFGYKPLPVVGTKVLPRGCLFFSKEIMQYSIPFMGSDPSVVKRTQRFLFEEEHRSPIQYFAYVGVGGLLSVVKLVCGGLLFWILVKFSLGRKLLTSFPRFFSLGLFSKAGPTMEQIEDTCFSITFFAEGYSEGTDPSQGPPNAKICTQVLGAEPGYVATAIAAVQAAVTLLRERHSLPRRGGVYTPGGAFYKTALIRRLGDHGFKFSVAKN